MGRDERGAQAHRGGLGALQLVQSVLVLLKDKERSDLLLLRLAIAGKATGAAQAAAWSDALSARFDAARLRGDALHQKEEARFALAVLGQPKRALPLASANYTLQREPADARVLLVKLAEVQEDGRLVVRERLTQQEIETCRRAAEAEVASSRRGATGAANRRLQPLGHGSVGNSVDHASPCRQPASAIGGMGENKTVPRRHNETAQGRGGRMRQTTQASETIVAAAVLDHAGAPVSLPPPARHHNILRFMVDRGDPTPIVGRQGFMTNTGEFVDRETAGHIAIIAGQIERLKWPPNLYSEDLW